MNKFWMVMIEGKGSPQRQHPTLGDAEKEAERLSIKEGSPAYVLELVEYCKPTVSWEAAFIFNPDPQMWEVVNPVPEKNDADE